MKPQISVSIAGLGTPWGGAVVGLIVAIICAFLWSGFVALSHIRFGLLACGIGFLVAFGVIIGSGGQRGLLYQFMSALITLFGMAFSEYLEVRHYLAASEEGFTLPILVSPDVMMSIIGMAIGADPMTLLFWGIAIYFAWKYTSEDDEE